MAESLTRVPRVVKAPSIGDMERAQIDIITDGEIRGESYSNRFATALSGVDLDHPGDGARAHKRHLALPAIDRALDGIPGPTVLPSVDRRCVSIFGPGQQSESGVGSDLISRCRMLPMEREREESSATRTPARSGAP